MSAVPLRVRPSGDVEGGIPHEPEAPTQNLTPKYTHLSASDIRLVLELHDAGKTQVEIASILGRSQATISNTLKAFNSDAKAVARQMRAFTDEAITDWRRAKRIAAKRGDHRPAREMLEAAYPDLRPVTNPQNYGGVTVVVAVPGGIENPRPVIAVHAQQGGLSPSLSDDLHKLSAEK